MYESAILKLTELSKKYNIQLLLPTAPKTISTRCIQIGKITTNILLFNLRLHIKYNYKRPLLTIDSYDCLTKEWEMTLLERLQNDIKLAMKSGNKIKVDKLRYIKGELERQDAKTKDDEFCLNALGTLRKKMEETNSDPELCEIISEYLPKQLTEQEIYDWLSLNVDFSKLKNKNQAIGILKKEFGLAIDSKLVMNILKKF